MIQILRRAPRALLVCLSLSLAACDEALGPNDDDGDDDVSRVTFQYSGARSGSFQAKGEIPASTSSFTSATWAAAERDEEFDDTRIYGLSLRPDGRQDIIALVLSSDQETGAYDVRSDCQTRCAEVSLIFGNSPQPGQSPEWTCTLTSGTVNLTALSNERARGTFSGQATCANPAQATQQLTVQGGTFDVAVTYAI